MTNSSNKIWDAFLIATTLIGFVADILALLALVSVNESLEIPLLKISFNPVLLLTLWTAGLVTYLGFLQRYWVSLSRKLSNRPNPTFAGFLAHDLFDFSKFRYPFHIVPLVFFVGLFLEIIRRFDFESALLICGCLFLPIGAIFILIIAWELHKYKTEAFEENFSAWESRIRKALNENKYSSSIELEDLYSEESGFTKKALRKFFGNFENELDLVMLNRSLSYVKILSSGYPVEKVEVFIVICSRINGKNEEWLTEIEHRARAIKQRQ